MTVAFLVAVVLCVLVVPVVRGCDNLAAGSCALSRDSCRYALLLRSFSTVAFVPLIFPLSSPLHLLSLVHVGASRVHCATATPAVRP
jgi:hypothetical protein